jgi:hypothetical protein
MSTIITGRDLTLTIDSDSYDAQATSATLTNTPTTETYQTLDGKAYKTIDNHHHCAKPCGRQWKLHQTLRWLVH